MKFGHLALRQELIKRRRIQVIQKNNKCREQFLLASFISE